MRTLYALAASAVAVAALSSEAADASGGAYTSFTVANAEACARACADDGICMAWTYDNARRCALSAVVPLSAGASDVVSGLAARAPRLAQSSMAQVTPETHAASLEQHTAPPVALALAPMEHGPLPLELSNDTFVLLGGPDEDALRLQLGPRQ
jgi:hypothetical protein